MKPNLGDENIIALSVYATQLQYLKEMVGRVLQQSKRKIEISKNIKLPKMEGCKGQNQK